MNTPKIVSFFSLFTSASKLICCALPALFVSVGLGAVMAGLIGRFPGLIWISENETDVFSFAALMLAGNGIYLWMNRNAPCPIDPALREACLSGRLISRRIYVMSLAIFLIGFSFAYLIPYLNR